jgi:elongation factor Tu
MSQRLTLIIAAVFAVAGSITARADDALFLPVEDSFVVAGMGVVATGTVVHGSVGTGDNVELVGIEDAAPATVVAIQVGLKAVENAGEGSEVSVILRGVNQDQVTRGRVIGAPDVLAAHSAITADVTLLRAGGRARPAVDGYRPLLKIWTHSVSGTFHLGSDQIQPGGKARVPITLDQPTVAQPGDTFDITEGGRSVGSGVIVSVQD